MTRTPAHSPDQQPSEASPQKRPRSLAEQTTFGIAGLILAMIVGLVLYIWFDEQKQQPPDITVSRQGAVREASGQFYVPFEIENVGGGTAESVQVIAELRIDGEVEESGEQQIDFLSGGETEEGAFVFSRNPEEGELVLRVASYKLP
ncbi:TIGR02588 family protein [Leptolyngbya sp. FACHB-541]|uniref:TIGR02588 family protein n=1 Tax=Leptolyngbya sp. FACHB-541 TaxID=2692810 RepID=UPI0016863788|nr:TIGR02588 family protein [Leptolyngbya sp. FACHB-541]MBD1998534.1 TIGR02588 family protein [Leptolyngbya sp. FACHB-541]